jgi:hypothetical protein
MYLITKAIYLYRLSEYKLNSVIYTFFARGTGGGGGINEQVTAGRAPSSKVHSWTPKHLQFLSSDFLYLLLPFPLFSDLKPPNRGAPGVPGVAGADGISSLLICSISPINSKFNLDMKRSEIGVLKWTQDDCCYCMFVKYI